MKNKPLVSILMNCYNGEKYLKEAIDSIYAQTYENWEIIFVDNCSVDGSADIAKSYDKRLKYYKTRENIPLGAARNWGLQFVKGEFLTFLDTDDIWLNNKLELQLKTIEEDVAFVYSSVIHINEVGIKLRDTILNIDNNFESLLKRYDINMHSTLINLNLVNVKFNEKLLYCPDYELFMNISAKGYNYKAINKSLVKYRVHSDSLSFKTIDIQINEIISVINNLKKDYPILYGQYRNTFKIAIYKFTYLINAKKFLNMKRYFKAAKELFFLAQYDKKYFIVSLLLFIPMFNSLIYNRFLKKYV
ncbi:MAG: glycosyltransferase [Campylobacteraceae bacterium]|nr:glycosyltransferase [Campylobacteraceae bacterium]